MIEFFLVRDFSQFRIVNVGFHFFFANCLAYFQIFSFHFAELWQNVMAYVPREELLRKLATLTQISSFFFLQEVKLLLKIFHGTDRTFDSSVRSAAAEILLENKPTTAVVRNLLLTTMADTGSYELSTYLSKKIVDMAKYNPTLR